jgi:hypothetical protein
LLPLNSTVPRNGTPPRMSILSIMRQPPAVYEGMATEKAGLALCQSAAMKARDHASIYRPEHLLRNSRGIEK